MISSLCNQNADPIQYRYSSQHSKAANVLHSSVTTRIHAWNPSKYCMGGQQAMGERVRLFFWLILSEGMKEPCQSGNLRLWKLWSVSRYMSRVEACPWLQGEGVRCPISSATILKGTGMPVSLHHDTLGENPVQGCYVAHLALVCVRCVQVPSLQMHGGECSAS